MNEQQALAKMIPPGQRRPGKPKGGVIQVWTTNVCNLSCFSCTQAGNVSSPRRFISVDNFEKALQSLAGYWGTVGMFGANCALHPEFPSLCLLMRKYFPKEQLGIWCNHPITLDNAQIMREVFNPAVSNLNVHLDRKAHDLFRKGWPEARPFGLTQDSRHAPVFVAMKDVIEDEGRRWELIADCPINKHWSAMVCEFRGQLRGFFCEIAASQAILHQDDPDYPDTGMDVYELKPEFGAWWQHPMATFVQQVRKHCHECSVPLNGWGELSQATNPEAREQTSQTHQDVFKPKRAGRKVEVVTNLEQLGLGRLQNMTRYLENAKA